MTKAVGKPNGTRVLLLSFSTDQMFARLATIDLIGLELGLFPYHDVCSPEISRLATNLQNISNIKKESPPPKKKRNKNERTKQEEQTRTIIVIISSSIIIISSSSSNNSNKETTKSF